MNTKKLLKHPLVLAYVNSKLKTVILNLAHIHGATFVEEVMPALDNATLSNMVIHATSRASNAIFPDELILKILERFIKETPAKTANVIKAFSRILVTTSNVQIHEMTRSIAPWFLIVNGNVDKATKLSIIQDKKITNFFAFDRYWSPMIDEIGKEAHRAKFNRLSDRKDWDHVYHELVQITSKSRLPLHSETIAALWELLEHVDKPLAAESILKRNDKHDTLYGWDFNEAPPHVINDILDNISSDRMARVANFKFLTKKLAAKLLVKIHKEVLWHSFSGHEAILSSLQLDVLSQEEYTAIINNLKAAQEII